MIINSKENGENFPRGPLSTLRVQLFGREVHKVNQIGDVRTTEPILLIRVKSLIEIFILYMKNIEFKTFTDLQGTY